MTHAFQTVDDEGSMRAARKLAVWVKRSMTHGGYVWVELGWSAGARWWRAGAWLARVSAFGLYRSRVSMHRAEPGIKDSSNRQATL